MTRVLVVEDSATVRAHLTRVLRSDPDIAVVGEAADGRQGVELCGSLRPDVVTLDLMLPVMNGVAATEEIMAHRPTPILIVSAAVNREGLFQPYDALAAGAVDICEKPRGSETAGDWEQRFLSAVKLAARVKVFPHFQSRPGRTVGRAPSPVGVRPARPRTVAIGTSTGGPGAIVEVLRGLPAPFPLPILFVIHISDPFVATFAEWLDKQSPHPTSLAQDGAPLAQLAGQVVLAPAGRHLEISGDRLLLSDGLPRHACRPSVDVLFESLARELGGATIGCLLTGMGRDGAAGLLQIRKAGGLTVAQDEASSMIYGMPREAALIGAAEIVAPLPEIGGVLSRAVTGV
jgi:two-component system chemotaxis response regulator CheB